MRARRSILVLAGAAALAACGKPSVTCGPDTHEDHGQCVVEDWMRNYAGGRVARAREVLVRAAQLDNISLMKQVGAVAADPAVARAIKDDSPSARAHDAEVAFAAFKADATDALPDLLAVVDARGDVLAIDRVATPVAKQWLDASGAVTWPALRVALEQRVTIADAWNRDGRSLMRVGIAPVVDPDVGQPLGAVVMAYALTASDAQHAAPLLGAEVAYIDGGRIFASSLDGAREADLAAQVAKRPLAPDERGTFTIAGHAYDAIAVRLPRLSSRPLPADYPATTATAMVLGETSSRKPEPR